MIDRASIISSPFPSVQNRPVFINAPLERSLVVIAIARKECHGPMLLAARQTVLRSDDTERS